MKEIQKRTKANHFARIQSALFEAVVKEGARFLLDLLLRLVRLVRAWVDSGAADFLPLF